MKLSIIMPVYNEQDTVAVVVEKVLSVALPVGIEKELVIVEDGSTDNTGKILEAYGRHSLVKIITLPENSGKSNAVITGLKSAKGNILVIQDADLEYCPSHYQVLLEPILSNSCMVVYGSRFLGSIKNMTVVNRWANRFSTATLNCLYQTSLTDLHTGLKMFKREVAEQLALKSSGFSIDTEITCRVLNLGYQIIEKPIQYKARTKKEGKKITWRSALETYGTLLACKWGSQ